MILPHCPHSVSPSSISTSLRSSPPSPGCSSATFGTRHPAPHKDDSFGSELAPRASARRRHLRPRRFRDSGVCGRYQMLWPGGSDLEGVEGRRGGGADGLGLLPVATRFLSSKGDPPGLPAETPRACCFEVMRSTVEGHSQLATTKTGALLAPKTRLGPMAILIRTTGPPRPLSSAP